MAVILRDQREWSGSNPKQKYTYSVYRFSDGGFPAGQWGNYIYCIVHDITLEYIPICFGEGELSENTQTHQAAMKKGATHIHVHFSDKENSTARRLEMADVIAGYGRAKPTAKINAAGWVDGV